VDNGIIAVHLVQARAFDGNGNDGGTTMTMRGGGTVRRDVDEADDHGFARKIRGLEGFDDLEVLSRFAVWSVRMRDERKTWTRHALRSAIRHPL